MRAGPKKAITAEPLDLSHLPSKGPKRVEAFAKEYLHVTKGTGARGPFKLRPFQREIVSGLFPTYGLRPRQGVVALPRGNGKSSLAAVLAAYGLYADGVEGAQVLCVASDERQARIVFNTVRRMVELEPRLEQRTQIFQDRLYVPQTDSVLMPLPADASSLQGFDPTLVIVDELHVVKESTWEAVALASGKRDRSLCLAISTPSDTEDSVMWDLVEYGREHPEDPSFFLKEYAAPVGCALDDESAWATANPALHDFLHIDALRATLKTTREPSFRRYRLGQWTSREGAWIPWGEWAACADPARAVPDGEPVVLFFDGSASGDSTALVGCTVDRPHLFVVDVWENPGDERWRVPRAQVDQAVDLAFSKYEVVELSCDPWGWRSEIEAWAARHGERRVLEYPTNIVSRMAPATDRLFQAVSERSATHDGDPRMATHVANCVARSTPQGDLVSKDRRGSSRKIDAAVAAIGAYERATFHARQERPRRRVVAW